jgi:AraC-like DNA-binding protein
LEFRVKSAEKPMQFRFSTDSVPTRERLSYFREALGRSFTRLDLGPYDDRPLRYEATVHGFDGLGVIWGRTNGNIGRRTQPLLTDGNDDFIFGTVLSGCSLPSQVGREFRMEAGAAVLLSCGDVGAKDYPVPSEFLTLRIPRRLLNEMAANAEDALARPIPANTEALRLLIDYVQITLKNRHLASPDLRRLFTVHIHDLVALAVGATRDAANIAYGRGVRAARLRAIKSDIRAHLRQQSLSTDAVAARQGITPVYVRKIFESEGMSFSKFVLEQRLKLARQMLTDARFMGRSIAMVASLAGFGDLSYFNRAFRRRFKCTPSDVRAQPPEAG